MRALLFILVLVGLSACKQNAATEAGAKEVEGASQAYLKPRYAQQFEVVQAQDCLELIVYADAERSQQFRYRLVQKGEASGPSDIEIPVRKAVALSTTHAALFEALDLRELLVAVSGGRYLYDPELLGRLESGALIELGEAGGFDYERLVALEPDLVISFFTDDPEYGVYPKLTELGLPAVINTEFREPHPLGQAEWIKFLGVLTGEELRAAQVFDSIEQRYLSLERKFKQRSSAGVFTGMPWKGEWTIPAGESFPAKYLRAAGANYLWAETEGTGSLFLDLEQMLVKAGEAELWLNPGAASSLAEIKDNDDRLGHFSAFKEGQVYNNVKRKSVNGGNDYWESGIVYPDRILSDLGAIVENFDKPSSGWQDSLWYYIQIK